MAFHPSRFQAAYVWVARGSVRVDAGERVETGVPPSADGQVALDNLIAFDLLPTFSGREADVWLSDESAKAQGNSACSQKVAGLEREAGAGLHRSACPFHSIRGRGFLQPALLGVSPRPAVLRTTDG